MKSSLVLIAALSCVGAYNPNKPYPQDFDDNYNVLKYTGNAGPYSNRRGVGISRDPPSGCVVDQAIILMRHGARHASPGKADDFEESLSKLNAKKGKFTGDLAFYNSWVPFDEPSSGWLGEESTIGPYNGLHEGYYSGMMYAERYGDLVDLEGMTPVFASGALRVVDTARRFIEGFFGYNATQAALNIIPETTDQGANSLTPTCQNSSITEGPCKSKRDYKPFRDLAQDWNQQYGVKLTYKDIRTLMEMAAYELNVRGRSPWISVFPSDAWVAFEHHLSAKFWCADGPGSPDALARGTNFINASRTMLLEGPEQGEPLVVNFSHDTDIAPVQAALGLDPSPQFNDSKIQSHPGYHVADVVPQGGRIIFERLTCASSADIPGEEYVNEYPLGFNNTVANITNSSAPNSTQPQHFVRVVVNEAVVPLDDCMSGPGLSCPLNDYNEYINSRISGREFSKVCNLTSEVPSHLTFWWDYNATTSLNRINETIPYQGKLLNYLGQPI